MLVENGRAFLHDLLENPRARAGNEWDLSGVGVGKRARVPSSKYKYFIPKECMYVSGEWKGISLAL